MRLKILFLCVLMLTLLAGAVSPFGDVQAASPRAPRAAVSAYDLILAMNTLRVSYGLPALIEDPIVNAVAQATADYMAANLMTWHIGDVRGRLAAAGYGGGATVWATENFAVGTSMSIDTIMLAWSDYDHMRPAVIPAYCHVGAGVATASNGMTYYILQAAYTSTNACGPYTYPEGTSESAPVVSQLIVPVQTATPDADGRIYHEVASGQSFWSIAIAYRITIQDLEVWNNLSRTVPLQVGQRLFIPSSSTAGYATPTPVGMIVPSTPAADGKIIHTVAAYQTLITIAQAYGVTVDSLLALNGIQRDWPLQIGQRLLISPGWVTPSPTPRPLTPVEMLTPASDGNYYHTVQAGETLSWIASLYDIRTADLAAWNYLALDSIIRPEQKLLLLVTPPPTATATPAPPTRPAAQASANSRSVATSTPRPATFTPAVSPAAALVTPTPAPAVRPEALTIVGGVVALLAAAALIVTAWQYWKKR